MKKLIPLLILCGGAVSGFAQGTISFQNSVAFASADPAGATSLGGHLVYSNGVTSASAVQGSTGNGLSGTEYVAELYVGADANSLVPLTSTISRFRAATSINRGKWAATGVNGQNTFIDTGLPVGNTITCEVKVWNLNNGASYEVATGLTGASLPFTYKTVAASDTTPSDFFMENLQGFALVPEPSAIALGVMGVAGLLLIRRRK